MMKRNQLGVLAGSVALAAITGYKIYSRPPSELSFRKGEITSCSDGAQPRPMDDSPGKWTCTLPLADASTPADADLLVSDDASDRRPARVLTVSPSEFRCYGGKPLTQVADHRYTCA
jgi:hypothetical protein